MIENNTTLIIEDNAGDAMLLKEQLNHSGWTTLNSENKSSLNDAIKTLRNFKPAVVFLDLNLPDSHGLETFLTINALAPDVPIIILSGINDTNLSVQAVKAGAQDYLVKGEFEEKLLLKTILYGIERKKNQLRLEEANMRYTLASKATNDPLWDWDIKSDSISWNDKIQIFGYHDSLQKNKSWRINNIHLEDSERVNKALRESLDNGKDQWSSEYRFRCADGTYKYVLDRGHIVRDSNKHPIRMIGTMQDLTEKILMQKHIDEERDEHQRSLLKATVDGQEKERAFISKELHDNVNQILTSANLYLQLAKPGNESEIFEAIETGRSYIVKAIDEIRKLSQSMSSSQIEEIGIMDAIEDLKNQINFLRVCKVVFLHSGDATHIHPGILIAIYRIVQEQVSNIVKHAKAQKTTISLDIEEKKIFLHIRDDGIGADLSQLNRKTGRGLLNIYNRVNAYNGEIIINTSPGKGFDMKIEFCSANDKVLKK